MIFKPVNFCKCQKLHSSSVQRALFAIKYLILNCIDNDNLVGRDNKVENFKVDAVVGH
jgi:hypothetical protein